MGVGVRGSLGACLGLCAGGGLVDNLRELKEGGEPDEPVSQQLWALLHKGFSTKQLSNVVWLLGQIGWSSLPAEQQHGSLAVFRRWHPEYGFGTLAARAMMMSFSRLLPSIRREEKELARLDRALRALANKNPDKLGGKQQLVSDLFAHLRSRGGKHETRVVPTHIGQLIFKRHNAVWARYTLQEKQKLTLRAQRAAGAKR